MNIRESSGASGDRTVAPLRVQSSILILTIVGYPFIASAALVAGLDNRLLSLPFRALVLALAGWTVAAAVLSRAEFRWNAFWLAALAFWSLYIARLLLDAAFQPDALRISLAEYLLSVLGMIVLPMVALGTLHDGATLKRSAWWIALLGGCGSSLAVYSLAATGIGGSLQQLVQVRQGVEALNPITLGHTGVTAALVGLWLLGSNEELSHREVCLLFVVVLTGLAAAITGASRGPLLAFACCSPLVLAHWARNIRIRTVALALGFGIAFSWIAVRVAESGIRISAIARVARGLSGADASISERIALYNQGIQLFAANPVLGSGIEPLGIYPHNLILEGFMFYGVGSGILLLAMLILGSTAAIRLFRFDPANGWLAVLLLQYLIGAMYSYAIYTNTIMWGLLAATVARASFVRNRQFSHYE